MNRKATLDVLINADVVVETDNGSSLQLTNKFADKHKNLYKNLKEFDQQDILEVIGNNTVDETTAREVLSQTNKNKRLITDYILLSEFVPEFSPDKLLSLLKMINHLHHGMPPSEGAPASFISIFGDELLSSLATSYKSIVYIWRNDCPSCDIMRGKFNNIFKNEIFELSLFAIYGPECPYLLQKKFDVVGGPTTLFVFGDAVNTRLLGVHHQEVIESEIKYLMEL